MDSWWECRSWPGRWFRGKALFLEATACVRTEPENGWCLQVAYCRIIGVEIGVNRMGILCLRVGWPYNLSSKMGYFEEWKWALLIIKLGQQAENRTCPQKTGTNCYHFKRTETQLNPLGRGVIQFDTCFWKIILVTVCRLDWRRTEMEADSCNCLDEEWDDKEWTNFRYKLAVQLVDWIVCRKGEEGGCQMTQGSIAYNWVNGSVLY